MLVTWQREAVAIVQISGQCGEVFIVYLALLVLVEVNLVVRN